MHRRRRTALTVSASAALLVGAPLLTACGGQVHPGAAALVGGDRIEVSTVQGQVAAVREAQRESRNADQLIDKSGQLGRAKLHGLIFDRVLDRAARDAGVTVERNEVQEMRKAAVAQSGGEERLRAAMLQQSWVAPEQIDAVLREQVQLSKLAQALGADLRQPEGQKVVGDALSKASKALKVDVNPRYGTWNDQQTQLADYKAPWISQVTKPAGAVPEPGA
ncbi:SurA N-terminal domain-containing protein [Streptomyces sp. NPDC047985]|uniref:SurA N-terminal domain-containing protein n=1 Tax=unclassified Streptomyces TaxID=2593676 RepID=UPI003427D95E